MNSSGLRPASGRNSEGVAISRSNYQDLALAAGNATSRRIWYRGERLVPDRVREGAMLESSFLEANYSFIGFVDDDNRVAAIGCERCTKSCRRIRNWVLSAAFAPPHAKCHSTWSDAIMHLMRFSLSKNWSNIHKQLLSHRAVVVSHGSLARAGSARISLAGSWTGRPRAEDTELTIALRSCSGKLEI
jgi:hypothetical protein